MIQSAANAIKIGSKVLHMQCGIFCSPFAHLISNFILDDISITIDIIRGNPKALPMASTCGQRMSVPLYPSRRILKRKLLQAIQCQTYGLG